MKIETLGGLLKAAGRKHASHVGADSTLQARAWVYQAMGDYFVKAEQFSRDENTRSEHVSQSLGGLIHVLAIDAQASLTPEKFDLLEGYPLTEEHRDLEVNKDLLTDALRSTWGEEDKFIKRLSGGLFGSYLQALSALKPHARALGHDLNTAALIHLKSL